MIKFELNNKNIESFLTLLHNGRLQSPIDEKYYDADVTSVVKT